MRAKRTRMKAHILKFARKMPHPNPGEIVLCEPAQPKHTWTLHQSHFATRGNLYTGKMPEPYSGHGILCEPTQSKRTWTLHQSHFARYFTNRKNAGPVIRARHTSHTSPSKNSFPKYKHVKTAIMGRHKLDHYICRSRSQVPSSRGPGDLYMTS